MLQLQTINSNLILSIISGINNVVLTEQVQGTYYNINKIKMTKKSIEINEYLVHSCKLLRKVVDTMDILEDRL